MKLGIVTGLSEKELKIISETGYECVELGTGPGSSVDANKLAVSGVDEVRNMVGKYGLGIGSLGFAMNALSRDKAERQKVVDYHYNLIEAASALKVKTICAATGYDREKTLKENVALFKEVYTPIVEKATDKGIRIAFENCPHGYPTNPEGGNLAFSPAAWEMLFKAIPSPTLGLEFDPSHLVWQGIDYIQAIRDFADRIYSFHAKDTEVMRDQLGRCGIYGENWWRYRIPGWGEIDWHEVYATLCEVGYDGNIMLEHEDPVFHEDKWEKGISLAFDHLSCTFGKCGQGKCK